MPAERVVLCATCDNAQRARSRGREDWAVARVALAAARMRRTGRDTQSTRRQRKGADVESRAAPETKNPMRHHTHYLKRGTGQSPYAGGSSFMERVAEGVASGMGTVAFVVIGSLIILGWVLINGAIPYLEHTFTAISKGGQFDPEPWILLNLIFSGVAFYTGALVIIAQKAQTRTDVANEPGSRHTVTNWRSSRPTCCRRTPTLRTRSTSFRRRCAASSRRSTRRPARGPRRLADDQRQDGSASARIVAALRETQHSSDARLARDGGRPFQAAQRARDSSKPGTCWLCAHARASILERASLKTPCTEDRPLWHSPLRERASEPWFSTARVAGKRSGLIGGPRGYTLLNALGKAHASDTRDRGSKGVQSDGPALASCLDLGSCVPGVRDRRPRSAGVEACCYPTRRCASGVSTSGANGPDRALARVRSSDGWRLDWSTRFMRLTSFKQDDWSTRFMRSTSFKQDDWSTRFMRSTSFKQDPSKEDVSAAALLRLDQLVEDLTTISPAEYERFGERLSDVEEDRYRTARQPAYRASSRATRPLRCSRRVVASLSRTDREPR